MHEITMLDPNFTKYYVEQFDQTHKNDIYFDAKKLQTYLANLFKEHNQSDNVDRVSVYDLLALSGNVLWYRDNGNVQTLFRDFLFGRFSSGLSSDDVINYNATRVELGLDDKFTDYVFNIAETLTSDCVQTTYVPNTKQFENTPEFLANLSEAMSGLDYIVDGSKIDQLNDQINLQADISSALENFYFGNRLTKFYQELAVAQVEALKDYNKNTHSMMLS